MSPEDFVKDLEDSVQSVLKSWSADMPSAPAAKDPDLIRQLVQIALANEFGISDAVAHWIPTTPEWDVKMAFARQAGDEARHFEALRTRLGAWGVNIESYQQPAPTGLVQFLKALPTSVERIAAGLFALESLAWDVNSRFIGLCRAAGDDETAVLFEKFIQPDEKAHFEMGRRLLLKYAEKEASQWRARSAAENTLQAAKMARVAAMKKCGSSILPGC